MIRIKPGRSWRLNPSYLGELRALTAPRARGFTGAEILDVLGVEVDGVDIAAGVGEARVVVAVDELAQALLRLGDGEPAAQATVGPGPTELVLEARGPDLLLTLVSLAPHARVLAGGLLVDARKMRAATLHAARGLLLDLLAISPALENAPLAKRLGESCAELARRPLQAARRWPALSPQAKTRAFTLPRRPESLQLQLPPETMARLHGRSEVKFAPLAAHLGQGSLALLRKGAPGLVCEGAIFLLLRNLLGQTEALIEAWETGEREFTFGFGPHELSWDLTREEVRAKGWRKPAALPPLRLAALAGMAARAYAEESLRKHRGDELAADLRDRALLLDRHCRDLESGDLRRAKELVAGPAPARAPHALQGPIAQGRIRRLVYREAWRARAGGALRAMGFAAGPLLVEFPDRIQAHDPESGKLSWSVAAAPGAVARGPEVLYAEPSDALVSLDAATGEVRWKRRLRGAAHPARLWALASGVLRSLPGEGLALVSDAGALTFRVKLPGGAPEQLAAAERVLVAALASGSLAGIDPADGRVIWKRRFPASAILPCGGRALVLSRGALCCIEAQTGEPAWEREVPEGAGGLVLAEGSALLLAGGALLSFALGDGGPRAPVPLPWARHLSVSEDPEIIVATGDGGAAARLDGKRWSLAAEDGAGPAPAVIQRGVVLLQRANTCLHGAAEGLLLAQLPPARQAALGADLSCALLLEKEIAVHRLAAHLSVL